MEVTPVLEEFKDCKRYTIEELRKSNYEHIKKINSNIVYFVEVPDNFKVEFLYETTAHKLKQTGKGKDENALYEITDLVNRYNNSDKKILYIGKGERKNNKGYKRFIDYLMYGNGISKPHDGGRSIWQIKNNHKLNIFFISCQNAAFYEYQLIEQYKKENRGNRPLANRNSGNSKSNYLNCKGCPRFNKCSVNK